jgi:hypothetical protein
MPHSGTLIASPLLTLNGAPLAHGQPNLHIRKRPDLWGAGPSRVMARRLQRLFYS